MNDNTAEAEYNIYNLNEIEYEKPKGANISYLCQNEQKKHDKPIKITDIAINKVPCTHVSGFTGEQNTFIQERHKEILKTARELCEKYRNDEMEAIILVDAHTWKYWVVEGKEVGNADIADNTDAKEALQTSSKNSLLL